MAARLPPQRIEQVVAGRRAADLGETVTGQKVRVTFVQPHGRSLGARQSSFSIAMTSTHFPSSWPCSR